MKLKRDANGNVVVENDMPVYTHDDGVDRPYDVSKTAETIKSLNSEAKSHRLRAETAETKLKGFEGIDPEAAKKALETVSNLDGKKLIDAGEVERLKASITAGFTEKLTAAEKRAQEAEERFTGEKVATAFLGSAYLKTKTVIPADMAQAYFGKRVRVGADGKVSVLDQDGNPLLSKANPGVPASFDEAMEILVSSHPQRDQILLGENKSGGGTPPGGGGNPGSKTATRMQFEGMSQADRMAFSKNGGKVTD